MLGTASPAPDPTDIMRDVAVVVVGAGVTLLVAACLYCIRCCRARRKRKEEERQGKVIFPTSVDKYETIEDIDPAAFGADSTRDLGGKYRAGARTEEESASRHDDLLSAVSVRTLENCKVTLPPIRHPTQNAQQLTAQAPRVLMRQDTALLTERF